MISCKDDMKRKWCSWKKDEMLKKGTQKLTFFFNKSYILLRLVLFVVVESDLLSRAKFSSARESDISSFWFL